MRVEIMLKPTGRKVLTDCDDVYEWGSYTCFQLADGGILKIPTASGIRWVYHPHRPHAGTTRQEQADD